jgi:acetyl esterase/lipase
MSRLSVLLLLVASFALSASAQKTISIEGADEVVRLWDNATAQHSNYQTKDESWLNSKKRTMINTSSCELYIFKADAAKNTGVAIAICPGGGYGKLNFSVSTARWFASQGITVALVKYRLPNGHKEVPLEDATGAVRYLRTRTDLGINPAKVGINGNSAGGHLAAWTSNAMPDGEKPAFAILYYPAINRTDPLYFKTFSTTGHLIGMDFPEAEADAMSAHHMVTAATPPTLLLLCDDDTAVPPTSPVAYYEALVRYGVTSSLRIFPEGGHSTRVIFDEACKQMYDWLDWLGLTKK